MIKKVSVRGYDFEVDFDYQPYEPSTRHYPGCSEDVEINEVMDSDGDIIKEYAFELLEYDLMEACLNAVHEDQDRVTDAQLLRAENRADLRHEINYKFIKRCAGYVTQV